LKDKVVLKRSRFYALIGLVLLIASGILYLVHFAVFGDAHFVYLYLLIDLAFLPIEVLLVTLVVGTLLAERDRRFRLEKLNMVIGAFFSEAGSEMLRLFFDFDARFGELAPICALSPGWREADFRRARAAVAKRSSGADASRSDLNRLRSFLLGRREFVLRLLENPNLLEHETFTDLLWAVHHLTEELAFREELTGLPETDYAHLSGDLARAYGLLIAEWLDYMKHLAQAYPYLYSLAVRTDPFNPGASVIV
jgi:hypothetical protein